MFYSNLNRFDRLNYDLVDRMSAANPDDDESVLAAMGDASSAEIQLALDYLLFRGEASDTSKALAVSRILEQNIKKYRGALRLVSDRILAAQGWHQTYAVEWARGVQHELDVISAEKSNRRNGR